MTVRRLVFSPEAEADLIEIWTFVAADDIRQADRLVDKIRDACKVVTRFPRAGRLRSDIAPAARVLIVGKYLVVYRAPRGRIEVARVFHGARDLRNLAIV